MVKDDNALLHFVGSCIDVYIFNRTISGYYTLNHNGNPIEVYCSFEGVSGYTYISKSSLESSFDLSKLFMTKNFAKIRTLLNNGTQKEVMVENIKRDALHFGYIKNNVSPFLYISFPMSFGENNKTIQGYRAADKTFNCTVVSSGLALMFNFYHNLTSSYVQADGDLNNFMTGWMNQSLAVNESKYMDKAFYFPFKMSMPECCGNSMTSNQVSNTKAALGLPFDIVCERLECCHEDDTGCCTSDDSNCTSESVYICQNINGSYEKMSKPCNIDNRSCPDQWSTWEDFGECSVTCGEGKKSQTRKRFLPCAKIVETVIQNNVCNKTKCPVYKWDYLNSMSLTIEEKKEMMKDELVELKANLTVDKKNTSSAIRRRTSAPDDRPSASSVGYIAILLLVIPLVLIVGVDSIRCFQSKKKYRKKRICPSQRETGEEQTVTDLKTE
ncbi:Hypothetical predicted protein [Mytilus galloprovincialis]|uniref:Uncharacterized protein n=1 Tax=Mytilus galloprovincialis TaxID=29158 RepID=A0A8B6GWN7_MYTGA|nr:Hypothetical predicted protein [Mytilus galloprovincialis]